MSAFTSLVQPQHQDDEAVAVYRSLFASRPARFVVIEDFLATAVAERLSRFLADEAQFATEYGLYEVEDRPVTEQEWTAADDSRRFFRFSKLVGARPGFSMSDNSLTYLRFRSAFQKDEGLRRFFEAVTEIELSASSDFGSHAMGAGDFLRSHDDDNRNRRLAIVLYLSPQWRPEFGGSLKIVDRDGVESTVEAAYNSLVAFDTLAQTTHHVVPISEAAGTAKRLTIGGWYHRPR